MSETITGSEFNELTASALANSISELSYTVWEKQAMQAASNIIGRIEKCKSVPTTTYLTIINANTSITVVTTNMANELTFAINHALSRSSTALDNAIIHSANRQIRELQCGSFAFDKSSGKRALFACENPVLDLICNAKTDFTEQDKDFLVSYIAQVWDEISDELAKILTEVVSAAIAYAILSRCIHQKTPPRLQQGNVFAPPISENYLHIAEDYANQIQKKSPKIAEVLEKAISASRKYSKIFLREFYDESLSPAASAQNTPTKCLTCKKGSRNGILGLGVYPFMVIRCPFETDKNQFHSIGCSCMHQAELTGSKNT